MEIRKLLCPKCKLKVRAVQTIYQRERRKKQSSAKKIESILKLKRYLYSPQSSARNVMETLALTI